MISKDGNGDNCGDGLYKRARLTFGDGRIFGYSHASDHGSGTDLKHDYGDGYSFGDGRGGGTGTRFGESECITALIIDDHPLTMAYQAATFQSHCMVIS